MFLLLYDSRSLWLWWIKLVDEDGASMVTVNESLPLPRQKPVLQQPQVTISSKESAACSDKQVSSDLTSQEDQYQQPRTLNRLSENITPATGSDPLSEQWGANYTSEGLVSISTCNWLILNYRQQDLSISTAAAFTLWLFSCSDNSLSRLVNLIVCLGMLLRWIY